MDLSHLPHHVLKDMGNRSFTEGHYQDALVYYSGAIEKQPNVSSYYSNRALCYVQVHEYVKALLDCKRSIELDENNLKAYFFAGQAHLGLAQWDEAVAKLMVAHNLALEQHRNFGDDITSVIRFARRKRFEALDEKRKQEEIVLQVYLNNLILQDAERQKSILLTSMGDRVCTSCGGPIEQVRQPVKPDENASFSRISSALDDGTTGNVDPPQVVSSNSPVHVHSTEPSNSTLSSSETPPALQAQFSQITKLAQKRITELNDLFAQVDSRRQKREVPEYLCGRISFELMLDPVITPSGITYDRPSIIAHLQKVGHFDPLTRQPLTESQLIPNLSMKEVVHAFLEENPWAENY
ncbi:hypothetical protein EG68_05259 [Paragonimus skrjabini miyazakii]|uniref:E3 ubiquitin-protein ligase CHIP n=1 Tax=Paragonimus skrjabini miyazakii TaxID=59628 RepID=A0A8S9YS12_9TREM|nr:hypothetical protein EG68_05259 [Paragonimus skrjabini miyazakii]